MTLLFSTRLFTIVRFICVFLVSCMCLFLSTTKAQEIDVTGDWTAILYLDGQYNNTQTWHLTQGFSVLSGNGEGNGYTWSSSGYVEATTFYKVDVYNEIIFQDQFDGNVSSDSNSMSGTWSDSFDQSGTWLAQRILNSGKLAPGTTISLPPGIIVSGKKVTFTLIKFSGVKTSKKSKQLSSSSFFELQALSARPQASRTKRTSVRYTVTIKRDSGSTVKRLTSKKNIITASNLKPGNYTASYQVSALRNNKRIFSTNRSPAASFSVGN